MGINKILLSLVSIVLLFSLAGCAENGIDSPDFENSSDCEIIEETVPQFVAIDDRMPGNALDITSQNEENWRVYGCENPQAYIPSIIHLVDSGVVLEYRNLKTGSLCCAFSNARFAHSLSDLPTPDTSHFRDGQSLYFLRSNKEILIDLDDKEFIQEDGSFFDGAYMVLVDVTVTSHNATDWTKNETYAHSDGFKVPAGEYSDPYLFRADALVWLSDLSIGTTNLEDSSKPDSYRTQSLNYFSELGEVQEDPLLFRLEPGEETRFTIGFLAGNKRMGGVNDLSMLALSDLSGDRTGHFIELKLDAPDI